MPSPIPRELTILPRSPAIRVTYPAEPLVPATVPFRGGDRLERLGIALAGLALLAAAARAEMETPLTPEAWVAAACERCDEALARKHAAIARLRITLADSAASESELGLADEECRLLAESWKKERRAAFDRLDFVLAGERATGLAKRLRALRAAAVLDEPRRGRYADPFVETLELLIATATPCEVAALEGTLVLEVYAHPLLPSVIAGGLDLPHALEAIHEAEEDSAQSTGSIAGAYAALRPAHSADPDSAFPAAGLLLRTLSRTRSAYAGGTSGPDSTACPGNDAPPSPPDPSSDLANAEAELTHTFLAAVSRTAEVPRIRSYLHYRIDELEAALRSHVPQDATDRLFDRVEEALYPDAGALSGLALVSPEAISDRMQDELDRWLAADALPAVQSELVHDPASASWFFIQTGAVPRPATAYEGSLVPIPPTATALSELRSSTFEEALTQLDASRIPDRYVQAFVELEERLAEITVPKAAALERAAQAGHDERAIDRLREYFGPSETVSTLDVYRFALRDANRIDGAVDWSLIAAALAELTSFKREALAPLVASSAGSDPALASYLQTAGELVLEMEARQATDKRFEERTGGAFVGYLLKLFAMSDRVPSTLWAPDGVTGSEFAELVDGLTLVNDDSGADYGAKRADDLQFVHDGQEYHAALRAVIDSSRSFLNLTAFDWKHDPGGQEIAYRLMAKKLGIDGERFAAFAARFAGGLPESSEETTQLRFYDIPPGKMKNLLLYEHFTTTEEPAVAAAYSMARAALGGELTCPDVEHCGDLSPLLTLAGPRYDPARAATDRGYAAAWEAFQAIEALFAENTPSLERTRPQASLAEYAEDRSAVQRYVRRHGLERADRPGESFPIHAVTDGKQAISNVRWWVPDSRFPFFFHDPFRSLFHPMQEFDIEILMWKGFLEFPWHLGPVPIPGRKIAGVIPMPFIPYPWLNQVPGFTWAGPGMSIFLQYLLAADVRVWWGMAAHSKSVSNERMALESGMGMAAKYMNAHPELKTWHDTGIIVTGPIVTDVNDHFVQVFNEARVNNAGGPRSRGLEVDKLEYADFVSPAAPLDSTAAADAGHSNWVLTTYPEDNDYNYRGIFMAALAAARKNIYIENAFFSDPLVAHMLVRKAREFRARVNCEGLDPAACAELREDGVQIHLIVPDSSDKPIIDAVGTADFHEMLHLGVKIYRWNPAEGWSARKSLHSKVWLVDYEPGRDGLSYVGSANATQRSHVADNEVGILSTSPALADSLFERLFAPDMLVDARRESPEHFHVVSARGAVQASSKLRKLLVNLFWFF